MYLCYVCSINRLAAALENRKKFSKIANNSHLKKSKKLIDLYSTAKISLKWKYFLRWIYTVYLVLNNQVGNIPTTKQNYNIKSWKWIILYSITQFITWFAQVMSHVPILNYLLYSENVISNLSYRNKSQW